MADATPSNTPKSQSQLLPPDTRPVQRFSSRNGYRSGDLSLGRQAVLKDLGKYLQVPYATLVRSAFGSPSDTSRIRQKLTEDGVLNVSSDGETSRWAGFVATPARSNASESVVFQPFVDIVSRILNQTPNCQVSFTANPSTTPLSERRNTSRPDAHIVHGLPATRKTHWFDIAIPFEFKKANDRNARHDNEQKMIWTLHHIMREDPLRRFALGITIENTDMRFWYSNRAFLAMSIPIDFTMAIDDLISLFYLIGSANSEKLGWDPTVERIRDGQEKIQYKFKIGNEYFITTRPLATYGADAIIGRGTRVYEACDGNGNIVAIKDSWRDEDREPEGAIMESIFKDIRDKLGEQNVADAEKYFVKIRAYEDVIVSGKRDETLNLREEGDIPLEWITINVNPILSEMRHIPSTGHIPDSDLPPTELARCRVGPPNFDIPCRVHTRSVFEEVGITLMNVTCLADTFTCLSGALQALYYLHRVGWVHRDFSVANLLWVEKDGQWIGKLTDFEYAKKVSSEVSHDIRTGTMHFMAVEVESQSYLFQPQVDSMTVHLDRSSIPDPPFRMNFLHDLESLWWAAIWVLFHHTDANSPTEDSDAQLKYFNEAFPRAIGQTSRRDFFSLFSKLKSAYQTLSPSYGGKCSTVIVLAVALRESYEKVEKSFPLLLFEDNLLEGIHKIVSDAYRVAIEQLKESNIRLQPLHELQERKRNIDDSPTNRAEKKAKRA